MPPVWDLFKAFREGAQNQAENKNLVCFKEVLCKYRSLQHEIVYSHVHEHVTYAISPLHAHAEENLRSALFSRVRSVRQQVNGAKQLN